MLFIRRYVYNLLLTRLLDSPSGRRPARAQQNVREIGRSIERDEVYECDLSYDRLGAELFII
jgi:hypothetical protein